MEKPRGLRGFLVAVVLAYAARTSLMVLLAWEALRASGRAGGPALVLAAWTLTEILAGPWLGVIVDRVTPYRALWVSEASVAMVLIGYAALRHLGIGASLTSLAVLAAVTSLLGASSNPSIHGVSRGFATPATATIVASRTASAGAFGFILGYTTGGVLLKYATLPLTLCACAAASLLVSLAAPSHQASPEVKPGARPSGLADLKEGLRLFRKEPRLRDAAIGFASCYSIFHSVTALLPPFGKLLLGLDSSQFGILRAFWSVGALVGAVGLSSLLGKRQLAARSKYFVLLIFGLAFIAFSQSRNFAVALLLIALTGVAFAICRSILDGVLFQIVAPGVIGRVRSNINTLISGVGFVIFLASIGIEARQIRLAFGLIGAIVVFVSIVKCARSQPSIASDDEPTVAEVGTDQQHAISQ